ncbi:MAG: FkbM family methyltransferase [Gemmatimonadaceae bacterium]|nr:FkbM family methyltransferase [Gemmatimonadaceae bacterium]
MPGGGAMESSIYAHHVGGRAGTVIFPETSAFEGNIHHVIYDADPDCIDEIATSWGKKATILPYCLADKRSESIFFVNLCPFTSSVLPFNNKFGEYYQKKHPLCHSDYLFKKAIEPQRELRLATEAIDQLFAEGRIPRVDFLSVDTQGSELWILQGAERMLETTTVAVACEVNFDELYKGAPLFGELDAFMRAKGFLLASLEPMAFGYKRIPRAFRGPGFPVQGDALYILRPDSVSEMDPRVRAERLEKLAFCALAFGYPELAHEAARLSFPAISTSGGAIGKFVREFYMMVEADSTLPPLWHECLEQQRAVEGGVSIPAKRSLPYPLRVVKKLITDPKGFLVALRNVRTRYMMRILVFLKLERLNFNGFESFLAAHGFAQAAKKVYFERLWF